MRVDYHIHTSRCGHAHGSMQEYIEVARNLGLREIGFSDHAPMYWLPPDKRDPGIAMQVADLQGYIDEVQSLAAKTRDLEIRLGLELDYIPGFEKQAAEIVAGYPFDYIIGSIHFIEGWAFDDPSQMEEYGRRKAEDIYRDYFSLLCQSAVSGLFDSIAHPDLVKKFGCKPEGDLTTYYREAARSFVTGGVCVEVNTAGLRWTAKEIYPSLEFLHICRLEGVPVVTGSDAHAPDQVGRALAEARDMLLEVGYDKVALFRKRQRRLVKL